MRNPTATTVAKEPILTENFSQSGNISDSNLQYLITEIKKDSEHLLKILSLISEKKCISDKQFENSTNQIKKNIQQKKLINVEKCYQNLQKDLSSLNNLVDNLATIKYSFKYENQYHNEILELQPILENIKNFISLFESQGKELSKPEMSNAELETFQNKCSAFIDKIELFNLKNNHLAILLSEPYVVNIPKRNKKTQVINTPSYFEKNPLQTEELQNRLAAVSYDLYKIKQSINTPNDTISKYETLLKNYQTSPEKIQAHYRTEVSDLIHQIEFFNYYINERYNAAMERLKDLENVNSRTYDAQKQKVSQLKDALNVAVKQLEEIGLINPAAYDTQEEEVSRLKNDLDMSVNQLKKIELINAQTYNAQEQEVADIKNALHAFQKKEIINNWISQVKNPSIQTFLGNAIVKSFIKEKNNRNAFFKSDESIKEHDLQSNTLSKSELLRNAIALKK